MRKETILYLISFLLMGIMAFMIVAIGNLSEQVKTQRQLLVDSQREIDYLKTIAKRGWQLVKCEDCRGTGLSGGRANGALRIPCLYCSGRGMVVNKEPTQ